MPDKPSPTLADFRKALAGPLKDIGAVTPVQRVRHGDAFRYAICFTHVTHGYQLQEFYFADEAEANTAYKEASA
jgi:hypothetical protein